MIEAGKLADSWHILEGFHTCGTMITAISLLAEVAQYGSISWGEFKVKYFSGVFEEMYELLCEK